METILFISAFVLVNSLIILLFYYFLQRVSPVLFILLCLTELAVIYSIAELFNQLDIYLLKRKVFIELGHAKIILLEILLGSLVIAVISMIISMVNRSRKKW